MTDTDREKWERVAKRIGKWKPQQKCECDEFSDPDADLDGQRWCEACHFLALDPCCPVVPHDIPCPDPSDPTMIVAMENYILLGNFGALIQSGAQNAGGTVFCVGLKAMGIQKFATTRTAALINAIDALPQEVCN